MKNKKLYLDKKIIIRGEIIVITGLHIGGTNNEMSIGGMDNGIIVHPVTKEPYIPGSSLKGKMRSLTELAHGHVGDSMSRDIQAGPSNDPAKLAAKLFGYTQYKEKDKRDQKDWSYKAQQPSRIIVRDCFLSNQEELQGFLIEQKTETVIDRITSAAMPRQMERVPANARFHMEMVLNVFEEEDEDEFLNGVFNALRMVQDDYLGGAGSRGSGQVQFNITAVEHRPKAYYQTGTGAVIKTPEELTDYLTNLTE